MFSVGLRRLGDLNVLVLAGHLLAGLAVVGLFLAPATVPAIVVTAGLGQAYAALAWRTRESVHLYPASLLLAAAYLLAVGLVGWLDALLFWALPLQLAFFGLGAALRRRGRVSFAAPLETAAHAAGLYLAIHLLVFSARLSLPILAVAGLALLVLVDLGLAWLHRERWFLFAAAIFLVLVYLFVLRFAPGGPPKALVVYFTGAAVAYALLSWWIRRARGATLAEPLEAAALAVGMVGGLAGLWNENEAGLHALLVGAIALGVLFAASRGPEYIYLITLSAGAIGFQFIRIAGRRFSWQLTDQFLVGLAIVGVVFLYPVVRRMVRVDGSLQGWLIEQRWVRVILVGLPLAATALFIGVTYTFELTANPTFCGSCHNMRTQYAAWDRGSHREITCDTCHYPPGAEHFVQGKIVGLTEVVNYFAGTYGTKPHGTVDNANCEACHPVDKLIGLSSPYRAAIKFNHAELEPGKDSGITMRCNNCHAHIVDGFHFQVRESTCYWCHFMGRTGQATAVGTCFTCHETPRDYTHMGVITSTNEKDCTGAGCHSDVTVGDGAVRSERCLACHGLMDPRAGQAQPMHDLHIVSQTTFLSRKIECNECHDEITHGEETGLQPVSVFGP
jgi:nitrate/TMAO reductase-like tetraheme cytochrome c subunit